MTSNKFILPEKYGLFVISYNRLDVLVQSINSFKRFFSNKSVYLIDKGSDYPPLLNYYKQLQSEGYNIVYSTPMISGPDGPGGLNDLCMEIDKYKDKFEYYAVTDPDISLENCEPDLLNIYSSLLDQNPKIEIVGPMLKIDDIPKDYPAREWCFTRHVDQFWSKKPEKTILNAKCVYFQNAPIDSTFGLLRASTKFQRLLNGIRVYKPYEAKHLDWYITPDSITDDQKYYMEKSNKKISHWGAGLYQKQPFHRILTSEERHIYTTATSKNNTKLIKVHLDPSCKSHVTLHNYLVKKINNFKHNKKLLISFSVKYTKLVLQKLKILA